MNNRWKTEHSRGLLKGTPIYAAIMPPGLTLNEQEKWTKGLRPLVGMNGWGTTDDGWRMEERQEFQSTERERINRQWSPYQ